MRSTIISALGLSFAAAFAQEPSLSRFGFQDVLLNSQFADVPTAYKSDCGSGSDKRFVFCMHLAKVGAISMTVEFTFVDSRVVEIQAYFPAHEFDTVWLALREKYGREDKRDADRIEWYSTPMHPDKPIADELVLRRKPSSPPKPDGTYYLANVEYSVIHYESLASARDAMRKRQEDRDRKVRGVAEKL